MKKLVEMLLIVCVILSIPFAVAESNIDLSSMTLEQLIDLHRLLDAEIDKRIGCEPSTIAGGVFIAGTTIQEGAYVITCTETYTMDGMLVQVFNTKSEYSLFSQGYGYEPIFEKKMTEGQTVTISLEEGMVLVIEDGVGTAETASVIWAP